MMTSDIYYFDYESRVDLMPKTFQQIVTEVKAVSA